MYETLMMIKNGSSFSPDEMDSLISKVAEGGVAKYERQGNQFRLTVTGGYLEVVYNPGEYVKIESREIAEMASIPCQDCESRYEMCGHADDFDVHMDLFNEYLLINEKLDATGKFFIYDQQQGKLFGEE